MTHLYTMLYVCYIKYFYQFNKSLLYLFSGKKSLFNQFSNKYKIEEEWFKKQKKKKDVVNCNDVIPLKFVFKVVRLNLFNHVLALFHAKFACNFSN